MRALLLAVSMFGVTVAPSHALAAATTTKSATNRTRFLISPPLFELSDGARL